MTTIALCTGAYMVGWLFPEWVFLLSPNAQELKRMPIMQNIMCAIGFALIAYGLRG